MICQPYRFTCISTPPPLSPPISTSGTTTAFLVGEGAFFGFRFAFSTIIAAFFALTRIGFSCFGDAFLEAWFIAYISFTNYALACLASLIATFSAFFNLFLVVVIAF